MIYAPIAPLPLMQVPDYAQSLYWDLMLTGGMPMITTGEFAVAIPTKYAYVYWGESRSDPDSVVLTISGEGVATIYLGARCPQMDNCTIKAVRVEQAQ